MFGFDKPEDGSRDRFHERVARHKDLRASTALHHFWWVVHNCVSHPLIGIAPVKPFFDFHDWTSHKINLTD